MLRINKNTKLCKEFSGMKKIVLLLVCVLGINFIFAQNETPNREAFTLKIYVDGEQYYEQKVEDSPYFVKEKVLQIYPEEKLFVEVEVEKKEIISMKVVKENLNPEKTVEIELKQTIEGRESKFMTLEIMNPFEKDLEYKAMMFIVGQDKWINTNVLPIKAKLTGYEIWTDVIITLVLTEWELK